MSKSFEPYLENGKVIIDRNTVRAIASTPPNECAICDDIYRNIRVIKSYESYYILFKWLEDNGYIEHLEQLIGEIKPKEKVWAVS